MRSVNIDMKWIGTVAYTCETCGKVRIFPVSGEEIDWAGQRRRLKNVGWVQGIMQGNLHDFCCERCLENYEGLEAGR